MDDKCVWEKVDYEDMLLDMPTLLKKLLRISPKPVCT